MKQKSVYLLLGAKGSGKSYIGNLIDRHFQIPFIRVEDWALTVRKGRDIDDPTYLKEVFQAIEHGLREALNRHDRIVFESTGLSDDFDIMLDSLRQDFNVTLIGIITDDTLCLTRVRSRDQSMHIDVSDDQVIRINTQIKEKGVRTEFTITNNDNTDSALLEELKKIIK